MIGYVDSKFKHNNSCTAIPDGPVSMVTTTEETPVPKPAAPATPKSPAMTAAPVNAFTAAPKNLSGCGIASLIPNSVK